MHVCIYMHAYKMYRYDEVSVTLYLFGSSHYFVQVKDCTGRQTCDVHVFVCHL